MVTSNSLFLYFHNKKEKDALERELQILEQKEEKLQLELLNARNDWTTARCELRNIEHQLGVERGKIKKFREEKNLLIERVSITIYKLTLAIISRRKIFLKSFLVSLKLDVTG